MDSTLQIRTRSVVLMLVVLVALLAAYTFGTAGRGTAPVAAAAPGTAASEQVRTITMEGVGEVTAVPDQLSFSLAVKVQGADVGSALADANAAMRKVQVALADAGVAERDLQTTGLSVQAVHDYPEGGPPRIVGYAVSQRLSVLVRSLDDSGRVIGTAVDAGGDAVRLQDLTLRVGERDALLHQARDAAVAEATAKAEQYAAASGESLAAVTSIVEVSAPRPEPQPLAERAVLDMASSKVPVQAGSSDLEVRVKVAWSLT